MDRQPIDEFDCEWDEATTRGVTRGLEELRDALTPDDEEQHLVRRHRGVIVLATVVAAFWLGVVGAFNAFTRDAPLAESVLAFEPEVAAAAAGVAIGPNEWPTIAMERRPFKFKRKAAPPAKPPRKKPPRK